MVEEEESIYLRNVKANLIPLGTVDLDALLLFSLRDFYYRGVARRSHGRVRPVLLSPSVYMRVAAAHA